MPPADEAGTGPDTTEQPTGTAGAAEPTESFRIGAEVDGSDGHLGRLERVIVDPIAKALTHLAIAAKHHSEEGRLVPIELVEDAGPERIRLRATRAEFEKFDAAEDVQFLPGGGDWMGYDGGGAMTWPYYGLGAPLSGGVEGHQSGPMFVDRIPTGEVDINRGDPVHASDGWIGSIQGLVVDRKDHHVTHVLLKEGHFWGRKQVAIPIGAVTRVDEEIRVGLTKQQVEDLPPVVLESGA